MTRLTYALLFVLLLGIAIPVFAKDGDSIQGTFKSPYAVMDFADAGDGIGLRVVGSQRTAGYLCGDGDTLSQGQQYVTVSIELTCDPARSGNCVLASFDFELAGANGIIYPNTAEEDDSAFDIPPGSEASGDVSAFISGDDTDIILLFYHFPTIPYTFPLVFVTGLEEVTRVSIPINATIGMIAREGPGPDHDFTGVFNRGEQILAYGRNEDGSWLAITFGWVPADLVEACGDIMSLPVTSP